MSEASPNTPSKIVPKTVVGARIDMKIADEEVAVEAVFGDKFFFHLTKEAFIGSPISVAYWLKDTWKVESEGLNLLLPYDSAGEYKTALAAFKADPGPMRQRGLYTKIEANLVRHNIPAPAHDVMITAFLAEIKITDLLVRMDPDPNDATKTRKRAKFGLAVEFPKPLELLPSIEINKLTLMIKYAEDGILEFPTVEASEAPAAVSKAASGIITFTKNPEADSKIKLGGQEWTFAAAKAAKATKRGANLDETLTSLAADLNEFTVEPFSNCTYSVAGHDLQITYKSAGEHGNKFALAVADYATVSNATLSGGLGRQLLTYDLGPAAAPAPPN